MNISRRNFVGGAVTVAAARILHAQPGGSGEWGSPVIDCHFHQRPTLEANHGTIVPSARPFSADEIAIYRHFLTHYQNVSDQQSNTMGMDPMTVPFAPLELFGTDPQITARSQFVKERPNFTVATQSGRTLPPEVVSLTDEKLVTRKIARAGKLADPAKVGPYQGPDGWVKTHFTLSEIAFDARHHRAAFTFSANCNCRGGDGGTVIFHRKFGRWKFEKLVDFWQG